MLSRPAPVWGVVTGAKRRRGPGGHEQAAVATSSARRPAEHCIYCGITTRATERVCPDCYDLPKHDPAFQAAKRGTAPPPWDMLAAELADTKQHERMRKGRDPVHT